MAIRAVLRRSVNDMKCCVDCFAHEWLREFILDNSEDVGECDYCDSKGGQVIEVDALYEPFHNLMRLYISKGEAFLVAGLSPDGEPLLYLIQEDYDVFDDGLVTSDAAARLLEDIMQSGWDDDSGEAQIAAHDLYVRYSDRWGHATMTQQWGDYCAEVKAHPRRRPHLHPLFNEELGRQGVEVQEGTVFYRSRLGYEPADDGPQPYEGERIGAPPPNRAPPGRANKRREVVLYVADDEETAIAEARPARGNLVSVAELHATRVLRLVDLRAPVQPSNPFTDETPEYEQELEHLLWAFAEDLARPLRRTDDHREYRPCQMLARRIRECGYDGVRYPSAMNPAGCNVVLFDPHLAKVGASKLVDIESVEVAYNTFTGQ
jgi:hypothetical protein